MANYLFFDVKTPTFSAAKKIFNTKSILLNSPVVEKTTDSDDDEVIVPTNILDRYVRIKGAYTYVTDAMLNTKIKAIYDMAISEGAFHGTLEEFKNYEVTLDAGFNAKFLGHTVFKEEKEITFTVYDFLALNRVSDLICKDSKQYKSNGYNKDIAYRRQGSDDTVCTQLNPNDPYVQFYRAIGTDAITLNNIYMNNKEAWDKGVDSVKIGYSSTKLTDSKIPLEPTTSDAKLVLEGITNDFSLLSEHNSFTIKLELNYLLGIILRPEKKDADSSLDVGIGFDVTLFVDKLKTFSKYNGSIDTDNLALATSLWMNMETTRITHYKNTVLLVLIDYLYDGGLFTNIDIRPVSTTWNGEAFPVYTIDVSFDFDVNTNIDNYTLLRDMLAFEYNDTYNDDVYISIMSKTYSNSDATITESSCYASPLPKYSDDYKALRWYLKDVAFIKFKNSASKYDLSKVYTDSYDDGEYKAISIKTKWIRESSIQEFADIFYQTTYLDVNEKSANYTIEIFNEVIMAIAIALAYPTGGESLVAAGLFITAETITLNDDYSAMKGIQDAIGSPIGSAYKVVSTIYAFVNVVKGLEKGLSLYSSTTLGSVTYYMAQGMQLSNMLFTEYAKVVDAQRSKDTDEKEEKLNKLINKVEALNTRSSRSIEYYFNYIDSNTIFDTGAKIDYLMYNSVQGKLDTATTKYF